MTEENQENSKNNEMNPNTIKFMRILFTIESFILICAGGILLLNPQITAEYLEFDNQLNQLFSGSLIFVGIAIFLTKKITFGKKDKTL